jgi:hypothetical protein
MAQNDAMKVWRYPIGAQESNVAFGTKRTCAVSDHCRATIGAEFLI